MPTGLPDSVPDDGLTTRQRRHHPLVMVVTGDGKGKSSSAFGTALRAWNRGWSICVMQFVKTDKWRTGEHAAFTALGELHAATGAGGPVEWHAMGAGWSWIRKQGTDVDHAAAALEGWREIQRRLADERHDFYLLDEFTYPMSWGWVDVDEVVDTLRTRPGFQHVLVTGRGADPRLVELADLVSEVGKVKHPMDAGRLGQRGIEW